MSRISRRTIVAHEFSSTIVTSLGLVCMSRSWEHCHRRHVARAPWRRFDMQEKTSLVGWLRMTSLPVLLIVGFSLVLLMLALTLGSV